MKRFITFAASIAIYVTSLASSVKDVSINVILQPDGSARITETWKLNQDSGTEWYLVRDNLGDIRISNFKVSENGLDFFYEGEDWDTGRSIEAKRNRCGIVRKNNGCELCWGLGSHGSHVFDVSYTMSNVVKLTDDYQYMHVQLVNPGLSSPPEHVSVTISDSQGRTLNDDNCRIWGFGFNGTTEFRHDSITAESSERFQRNSSVIMLVRFEPGFYSSSSITSGTFQEHLDKAMDGADFGSDDDDDVPVSTVLGGFLAVILGLVYLAKKVNQANNFKITGYKRIKDIEWSREVPFKGNILEANYVMAKIEPLTITSVGHNIASAFILRMIENGNIVVGRDAKDKVELSFNLTADKSWMSTSCQELYQMMIKASGNDQILQDKEFSRWANRNTKVVDQWVGRLEKDGRTELNRDEMIRGNEFTDEGKRQAASVFGFRKFLKDFTLIGERRSQEVGLWNNYLVFGALFGIAEKVAKELKDIDPKIMEQTVYHDPVTAHQIITMSNRLSRSITNASAAQQSKAGGGHGGCTSFGGGGGFSGGGFGGGAR